MIIQYQSEYDTKYDVNSEFVKNWSSHSLGRTRPFNSHRNWLPKRNQLCPHICNLTKEGKIEAPYGGDQNAQQSDTRFFMDYYRYIDTIYF